MYNILLHIVIQISTEKIKYKCSNSFVGVSISDGNLKNCQILP